MTKHDSLIAVFDIGSASVGGLLLKNKDDQPEILTSLRKPVDFSEESTFPAILKTFQSALAGVSKHLQSAIKIQQQKTQSAVCVFSSPWYVSQTKTIKIKREKSFTITKSLITQLIKEEADKFQKYWKNTTQQFNDANTLVENEPLRTRVNGYDVDSPLDKTAEQLELSIYLSLSLDLMQKEVEENILTYIRPQSIYFHTFPFVLFKILKNIINTEDGLILTDITGELTDIFLIRQNIIEEANCFNKGENFLIRRLASVLNKDFYEAKSLMAQYQRKELDSAHSQKINELLKPAGKEWAESLKKILKEMTQEKFLPQNFYFCGPSGSLKEISGQISDENFAGFTASGEPFNVQFLLPEALKYHFNFKNGFLNNKDIFLLLSALFSSKFLPK